MAFEAHEQLFVGEDYFKIHYRKCRLGARLDFWGLLPQVPMLHYHWFFKYAFMLQESSSMKTKMHSFLDRLLIVRYHIPRKKLGAAASRPGAKLKKIISGVHHPDLLTNRLCSSPIC